MQLYYKTSQASQGLGTLARQRRTDDAAGLEYSVVPLSRAQPQDRNRMPETLAAGRPRWSMPTDEDKSVPLHGITPTRRRTFLSAPHAHDWLLKRRPMESEQIKLDRDALVGALCDEDEYLRYETARKIVVQALVPKDEAETWLVD